MEQPRWARYLPLTGIVAVALWTLGWVMTDSVRSGSLTTAEELLAYYTDNSETLLMAIFTTLLGSMLYLVFVASLWSRLRRAEGDGGPFAPVAFAAGMITAIGQFAVYGSDFDAALDAVQYPLSPSTAEAYFYYGDIWFVGGSMTAGLMLLATAGVVIRTRLLARWIGWVSIVLGVSLLLPPVGAPVMFFVFPLWVALVAILLVVAESRHPAPPVVDQIGTR